MFCDSCTLERKRAANRRYHDELRSSLSPLVKKRARSELVRHRTRKYGLSEEERRHAA
jgi:hypothetical protein